MSFLYPRTISVRRPNTSNAVGDQGYSAERAADEAVVLSGLPASIQLDRQGQRNPVGLPADAAYKPIWKVFIPLSAAVLGSIQSTDVIVDDLGQRYQCFAAYWDSLGYECRSILLEV